MGLKNFKIGPELAGFSAATDVLAKRENLHLKLNQVLDVQLDKLIDGAEWSSVWIYIFYNLFSFVNYPNFLWCGIFICAYTDPKFFGNKNRPQEKKVGKHWSNVSLDAIYDQEYLKQNRGCPRGVMVKAMDCGIVLSEFELQSRYYVHFRANTLGKGM